jgi:glutamine phosphoribosylpyrophosphate amidotransferase
VEDAIISRSQVKGAFAGPADAHLLIAARDPHGFRPLALGQLGDAWVACSETCAMDLIGATYVREVEPGEVLVIGPNGPRSYKPFAPARLAHCVFEHVYFARPDSYVFGQSVNEVRTNLGRALARGWPRRVVPFRTLACVPWFARRAAFRCGWGSSATTTWAAPSSSRSSRSGTSACASS